MGEHGPLSLNMKVFLLWRLCFVVSRLCFTFDIESGYFVFRVLPFGLSSACYLFTKMFKPSVAGWRSFGIFAFVYIDDGIFACRSLLDAQSASKLVRPDLQLSGWKSNEKKVTIVSDNQNFVGIVHAGSSVTHLQ